MKITPQMLKNVEPDPFAHPDTGAMGTLAWETLPQAEKDLLSALVIRVNQGATRPGDKALLEKYLGYIPAMVRSMDDLSIVALVLDVEISTALIATPATAKVRGNWKETRRLSAPLNAQDIGNINGGGQIYGGKGPTL